MLREKSLDEARLERCCDIVERNANGKLRLDLRRLDINPVIAPAIDIVRPAAEAKGVKLRIADCGLRIAGSQLSNGRMKMTTPGGEQSAIRNPQSAIKESAVVMGDAARLQQIVWNLLSNAIKFTPTGGSVELRAERAGEHIRIVVSDTGIGKLLNYFHHFRGRQFFSGPALSRLCLSAGQDFDARSAYVDG